MSQMDRKETFLYEKASRYLGLLNYSLQMFLMFCLMKLWSVCMKRKCNKKWGVTVLVFKITEAEKSNIYDFAKIILSDLVEI
jgi:hypothetical protein